MEILNKYQSVRPSITTGDLFGVEGRGWVGKAIRVFTGQQLSHVAVLVKGYQDSDGIWVAEFVEGTGYQMIPASEWLTRRHNKKQFLYLLRSPEIMAPRENYMLEHINSFRAPEANQKYGYFNLLRILSSQIFNRKRKNRGRYVCSTFAQSVWKAGGYLGFQRLADPGDFMQKARAIVPLGDI